MSSFPPSRAQNVLMAAMSRTDAAPLLVEAVPQRLKRNQVVFDADDRLDHVYFVTDGVVSLTVPAGDKATEVAMVGREGFLGVSCYLSRAMSTVRATAQSPCVLFALPVDKLRSAAAADSRVANVLHTYVAVHVKTLSQSCVCRAVHRIEQQVARWILTYLDRAQSDRLDITHQALGRMLGVRRASVTEAAQRLQDQKIIEYRSGSVTVRNRKNLEKAACECYRSTRDFEIEQLKRLPHRDRPQPSSA